MKVGFIGLGIMGSRMAANLLKNGVDVTVYNRSEMPAKQLEQQGAKRAINPDEAVREADIVFSMLSTPEVVTSVFLAENGVLNAMKTNAIWVDCSTVNPSFSLEAARQSRENGIRFLDAPVAGTLPHAENAQLTFFVGGEKVVVAEVQPFFEHMGQKVIHIGETGKGASFKMLVNMMLAQSMLVFSEAILLGEKMGIDTTFLLDTIPNLVVAAPFTKFKANMVKSDEYDVMFPLEWMHKDLHLATMTAYENEQPLYLANLTKELFAAANKEGMGRLDFAAIHRYLKGKN